MGSKEVIDFGMQFLLDVGIIRYEDEQPRQGNRDSISTSQDHIRFDKRNIKLDKESCPT
jgi:hypothetical protein